MRSSLKRRLPDAALLGAFLAVLSVAALRRDFSAAHAPALAMLVPDARASRTDSARAAMADSINRARQDSINRAQPGYVIDSILPVEEELRRFRAVAGPEATSLTGGFRSLDAVVKAFVTAVEQRDTVTLNSIALSPSEFAWLVYPSSPFMRAPYRQAAGLLWMSIHTPSDASKRKLLARFAGKPLGVAGYRCDQPTELQGENLLHPGCVLQVKQRDGTITHMRLFGTIIERHGTFKLVSFDNGL